VVNTPSFKLVWHTVRVAAENEQCYLLCLQRRKLLTAGVYVCFMKKNVMNLFKIIFSHRVNFEF